MDLLNLVFPEKHELAGLSLLAAQKHLRTYSQAGPTRHPWVTAVLDYTDPKVRGLVRILKNRPHPRLLRLSSEIMHEHLIQSLSAHTVFEGNESYLVIPIPSHISSVRKRGFNHAGKLAKSLASRDSNFKFHKGLIKSKRTSKQALLKRSDRLINIKGSFRVKLPEQIKDNNIILVDDIITTGATMTEAKKVLLAAGAKSVMGCTLAYAAS